MKRLRRPKCNKIVQQLTSFHKSAQSSADKFTQFSRLNDSLDSFYISLFPNSNQSHPDLSFILKLILVLIHGQASVEQGFSLQNATLKDNISELSLDSKHLIIDHMLSSDIWPETIEISTSLSVAFKSAHTKYEEAKCAMKNTKEKSKENLTNQLGIQINQLKLKVADIKKNIKFPG